MNEKGTTFNKYLSGSGRRPTAKELASKNQKLKRQYAPVRLMTAEEYEQEKCK